MKSNRFVPLNSEGQIAQSVEQRTENPCVGGSIPSLPTCRGENYRVFAFLFLKPINLTPTGLKPCRNFVRTLMLQILFLFER